MVQNIALTAIIAQDRLLLVAVLLLLQCELAAPEWSSRIDGPHTDFERPVSSNQPWHHVNRNSFERTPRLFLKSVCTNPKTPLPNRSANIGVSLEA